MLHENFTTTLWPLIACAGSLTPDGCAALAVLCSTYWYPVYAFIRRSRSGGSPEDAFDRTQSFFTCLLARNDLPRARGSKFHSWLLRCVKSHVSMKHDYENAHCRIPPEMLESLDAGAAERRYQAEASHHLTPERLFNRSFTLSLLGRVLEKLRAKYVGAGKEQLFEALKGSLSGDAAQLHYDENAASLGMTVGAVKKATFDLRARYKTGLRAEIASLVDTDGPDAEAAVEEEIRQLLEALKDEPA